MATLSSPYMTARDVSLPTQKTRRIEIVSRSSGGVLGDVKWYGPWRQYCFFPGPALFNGDCLRRIVAYLTALNDEHRAARQVQA